LADPERTTSVWRLVASDVGGEEFIAVPDLGDGHARDAVYTIQVVLRLLWVYTLQLRGLSDVIGAGVERYSAECCR